MGRLGQMEFQKKTPQAIFALLLGVVGVAHLFPGEDWEIIGAMAVFAFFMVLLFYLFRGLWRDIRTLRRWDADHQSSAGAASTSGGGPTHIADGIHERPIFRHHIDPASQDRWIV